MSEEARKELQQQIDAAIARIDNDPATAPEPTLSPGEVSPKHPEADEPPA